MKPGLGQSPHIEWSEEIRRHRQRKALLHRTRRRELAVYVTEDMTTSRCVHVLTCSRDLGIRASLRFWNLQRLPGSKRITGVSVVVGQMTGSSNCDYWKSKGAPPSEEASHNCQAHSPA